MGRRAGRGHGGTPLYGWSTGVRTPVVDWREAPVAPPPRAHPGRHADRFPPPARPRDPYGPEQLGDLLNVGRQLDGVCRACGRRRHFDPAQLLDRHGIRRDTRVLALERSLICAGCGRKAIRLMVVTGHDVPVSPVPPVRGPIVTLPPSSTSTVRGFTKPPRPPRFKTLGDLQRAGRDVVVTCRRSGCAWHERVPPVRLLDGRSSSFPLDRLAAGLRCGKCGSPDVRAVPGGC